MEMPVYDKIVVSFSRDLSVEFTLDLTTPAVLVDFAFWDEDNEVWQHLVGTAELAAPEDSKSKPEEVKPEQKELKEKAADPEEEQEDPAEEEE